MSDKPPSGRPCTTTTPKNEAHLHQVIRANQRITVNEKRAQLDVGVGALETMLSSLGYKTICARSVPRMLTQEQKDLQLAVSQEWWLCKVCMGIRTPDRDLSLTPVATSELTNPSLNRVDINCLGSVNVHQASVNVDWFNFFWVEEFHDASLLLTHFHDRGCFLRLSHRQYLQQRDKNFRILARRFSHHNNAISNPLGPLGAE